MKKVSILELIATIPDEIDVDDLIDRLFVLHAIEVGEAAAATGDVYTHEDVVRLSDKWRLK